MKKGISSVIAVVLLLLIAVGITWTVYTWLTGTMTTVTEETGESIEKKTEIIGSDFVIAAAGYNTANSRGQISISNTGTNDIDLSKITIYLKGVSQSITSGNTGTLSPGSTATLEFTNTSKVCGEVVRVVYAGVIKEAVADC